MDHAAKMFGRVDILVSNAGIDHFGNLEGFVE
jgi:NAD(P)-dependent dehydrogenase (short-subunit alcohol dehydrogenase family)